MDFTDLSSLFQQNRQIIIIFGLVIVCTMVFNIIRFKSMKKSRLMPFWFLGRNQPMTLT
jgi:hypothetical protein